MEIYTQLVGNSSKKQTRQQREKTSRKRNKAKWRSHKKNGFISMYFRPLLLTPCSRPVLFALNCFAHHTTEELIHHSSFFIISCFSFLSCIFRLIRFIVKMSSIKWDEETIAEHDKLRGTRQKVRPTSSSIQAHNKQNFLYIYIS